MLVWRGWGILVLVLGAVCGGGGTAIGVALGGATDHANLGTAVGLALAGVAIWFLGKHLNRPVPGYHPQTGQPVTYRNQHQFFFVPMQFFGPVAGAAAVAAAVIALTS
ncbi:hypothetical protein LX15_002706 [Streptoalloteichus tenebrarius]|uniref:Uncharacterized protein n=1 Tax=Streptoalloteichus tenebrarius (strain ATCC 17920 / DSM 40477 / JCM 4838 / CBS 697.72 / NBRC 16177 / NCIMB 11028 / NRRL B-12390 / A12253. 1 / ISP 5477) TaxID=1933 RepID=A0ABT1HU07_STRSD|nr:hypothetical protein [Streptoalloteichus tenebrarius]MCP2259007.1 hypothetical protein [Streptoalloteichus tenebrarius]BFF01220.1 hypothetical protein GCM10020241_28950 [Streptoalloteichus tenebrarius]